MEMIIDNCPLEGMFVSEKGRTRHVLFEYSAEQNTEYKGEDAGENWARSVVNKLLNDWCSVCKLYQHASELDVFLNGWYHFDIDFAPRFVQILPL